MIMVRKELEHIHSKEKHTVSFFEDDSIQVLREQIAHSANSHPDRMFILVGIRLPADYYTSDLRHWEALFNRLSYNGKPIEKKPFEDYQLNYRSPNTRIGYKQYDKAEWMEYPSELKPIFAPENDFIEYRILGVEENKSFILPFDSDTKLLDRISSANIPTPQVNVLITSLYNPEQIERFIYDVYIDGNEALYHYPRLTSETPLVLSLESIKLLEKNAKLLNELLSLKIPDYAQGKSISIIKSKFFIPWVETDFGSAVRTRFEQMFYGLTVSKSVPYIMYFTSESEINRHKFYVEDVKKKEPYLDMSWRNSWTNISKPQRNKPTLLLYRGKSKHHFDRIAITATDMIITTFRPENSTETLKELRKECENWIKEFDSILPFIEPKDIHPSRWEIQDMSYVIKYDRSLDELNLLRYHCISSIYGIADKSKSLFNLLRSDHENHGISSIEVKLIQMMREGPIDAKNVSEELSITQENARKLIASVYEKLEENSKLSSRVFRGYPSITIGSDFVVVASITEIERSSKYVDILRYVLSNPDSDELDKICGTRMQSVPVESAVIKTNEESVDEAAINEYDDLFDESFTPGEKEEEESVAESTTTTQQEVVATQTKQKTDYGYFQTKLQQFDPNTFPEKSDFSKKCDQKHQPVVLTEKDKKELADKGNKSRGEGKFNIDRLPDEQKMDVEEPSGTFICPEYWCIKDEVPLREEDLVFDDEGAHCPVCMGKLQTGSKMDVREYPLIKRISGVIFPGLKKDKSPINGRQFPCCFKTPQKDKKESAEVKDKYYVFQPVKRGLKPLRLAKLDDTFLKSLHVSEKYTILDNNRIPESVSGFFRVGLGNPSETLSQLLGMKDVAIPSPREAIKTVIKCSFFSSWSKTSTTHYDEIEEKLKSIESDSMTRFGLAHIISGIDDAFHKKELEPLQELEYAALSLQCDVFRVHTDTMKVGCLFYTPMVRPKTRAIVVLQENHDIDILSYARRDRNTINYKSNIYEEPFGKETVTTLETLRNSACSTSIPSYETALGIIGKLYPNTPFSIILDPYARGQALYIPDKVILPFKNTPIPDSEYTRITGYKDVDRVPTLEDMKEHLKVASQSSNGYEFQEELYSSDNQVVEILLKSGLRVPVKSSIEKNTESGEILHTVQKLGENSLVFGKEDEELKQQHNDISYESEIYEFLLFELTKYLQVTNFDGLRDSLNESPLRRKAVEPRLKRWFEKFTDFVDINKPYDFISKIRTPCGQFKDNPEECNKGNLCGYNPKTKVCQIKIKKSVNSEKLFSRLFSNLFNNSKIRSMVLDGRTTPFFSTILYLELPHELIITDKQLDVINV